MAADADPDLIDDNNRPLWCLLMSFHHQRRNPLRKDATEVPTSMARELVPGNRESHSGRL